MEPEIPANEWHIPRDLMAEFEAIHDMEREGYIYLYTQGKDYYDVTMIRHVFDCVPSVVPDVLEDQFALPSREVAHE